MNDGNARAGWIVAAAVGLALAGAAAWAGSALSDAKQAAADAAADTAECRRLAGQITTLRGTPSATRPADAAFGPRLAAALAAADIGEDALARVASPPRGPAGNARQATQVSLRRVTLRQALSLVGNLVGGGLALDAFTLTVPAAEPGTAAVDAGDEWDVELSVSQMADGRGRRGLGTGAE